MTISQLQICNGHRTARITQSFNPTGIVFVFDLFYKHMSVWTFLNTFRLEVYIFAMKYSQDLIHFSFNAKWVIVVGTFSQKLHISFPSAYNANIWNIYLDLSEITCVHLTASKPPVYQDPANPCLHKLEISLRPYHQSSLKAWSQVLQCLHYPLTVSNKKPCNSRHQRTVMKIVQTSQTVFCFAKLRVFHEQYRILANVTFDQVASVTM